MCIPMGYCVMLVYTHIYVYVYTCVHIQGKMFLKHWPFLYGENILKILLALKKNNLHTITHSSFSLPYHGYKQISTKYSQPNTVRIGGLFLAPPLSPSGQRPMSGLCTTRAAASLLAAPRWTRLSSDSCRLTWERCNLALLYRSLSREASNWSPLVGGPRPLGGLLGGLCYPLVFSIELRQEGLLMSASDFRLIV